ncbi:MAG: hypothetical protein AB7K24_17855, partial [Gemmataceae bacterium]
MPISFNCPSCGQIYRVPDEVGGRSTKCRRCTTVIQIPKASTLPDVESTGAIQQKPTPPAPRFSPEPAATPASAAEPGAGWK